MRYMLFIKQNTKKIKKGKLTLIEKTFLTFVHLFHYLDVI